MSKIIIYNADGSIASSTDTSGGSSGGGGTYRAVVYAGGNSVASLAANGTQDTYIYSTTVGGSMVNTGAVWMPDASGSIVGVSMTNTGTNNGGQNNVQFQKNGSNLGTLQVLGPVTAQNTCGISIAKGVLSFAKGDAIRIIAGNNTAGSFNCEIWFTVEMATT